MLARTMSEHSSTISPPRLQQQPRRSISQVRPEAGAIKFNVNAAVGLVYAAVAMVVRNQRGTLLFVCSKKVYTSIPFHTEAEALKWAVSLAAALSCNEVVFEQESQGCIQAIRCNRSKMFKRRPLKLAESIPNPSFCWSPRDGNRTVHSLAKWCLRSKATGYLIFVIALLVNLIIKEASSVVDV